MAAGQVQQRQIVDKGRSIRRLQNLARDSALAGDQLEHQVESAEALEPSHEHEQQHPNQRKKNPRQQSNSQPAPEGDEPPHIDVKA